ncbi:MAG: flagellar hook-basal body complex protein FliE [Bacillota bacterium]|nr:flagellar hook-basal body complex protein FliE [Bacillota bacterium]
MTNVNFPAVSNIFASGTNAATASMKSGSDAQKSFAAFLKESINNVNETQNQSDILTNQLARGENVDLHQVMISAQKANITLQATMEIRNKVIDAYQEVMRMQV